MTTPSLLQNKAPLFIKGCLAGLKPAAFLSMLLILLLAACLRPRATAVSPPAEGTATPSLAPRSELGVFVGDSWSLRGTLRGTLAAEGPWGQGHPYRALYDAGGGELAFANLYTLLSTEESNGHLQVRIAQPSFYLRQGGEPLYPRSDFSVTVTPFIPPAPDTPPPLLTLDWETHENTWQSQYNTQLKSLPGVIEAEARVGTGSVPLRGGRIPTLVFEMERRVLDRAGENDFQERSRWEYVVSTGVLARWVHEANGVIGGVQVDVSLSFTIDFFRRAREP